MVDEEGRAGPCLDATGKKPALNATKKAPAADADVGLLNQPISSGEHATNASVIKR